MDIMVILIMLPIHQTIMQISDIICKTVVCLLGKLSFFFFFSIKLIVLVTCYFSVLIFLFICKVDTHLINIEH